MGRKVYLTPKQEEQIISFFENSHRPIVYPDDIDSSGIIALFRACRDYCCNVSGRNGWCGKGVPADERAQYREELITTLDKLAIRYYERI